jgi:hypothetical protein
MKDGTENLPRTIGLGAAGAASKEKLSLPGTAINFTLTGPEAAFDEFPTITLALKLTLPSSLTFD